jgi:NAD+ synthase (glutamine-hydrolysing)
MQDPKTAKRSQLRVGVAQFRPKLAELDANLDTLSEYVDRAVAEQVDLLITPELALTGYPVGSWFSSASIGLSSPQYKRLKKLSRRIPMIVGLIEETEDFEFFNSAVYLNGGRVEHLHRKIYLPTYREFDERRYFKAGWSVSAFDTPWGRLGMLICGDAWHLTLPYLLCHDGADVIVVLAASAVSGLTEEISSQEAWQRMNRSYALTLSSFLVFTNLVGEIGGKTFWGGSHVVLPDGRLLQQASFEDEELLVASLDLKQLRKQRLILPFRRDDSLSLTAELSREILLRKSRRIRSLGDEAHEPIEPMEVTGEPQFPPVGVSDLEFGAAEERHDTHRTEKDRDAD